MFLPRRPHRHLYCLSCLLIGLLLFYGVSLLVFQSHSESQVFVSLRNLLYRALQLTHKQMFFPHKDFYYETDIALNQSSCCLSVQEPKDICGKSNCEGLCNETLTDSSVKLILGERTDNLSNKLRGNNNAFFIESSGKRKLNYRQLCSIESLAFHNPNLTIYVLFTDRGEPSTLSEPFKLKELQVLKKKYGNVNAGLINLNNFVAGTALEHWYHCVSWRDGPYSSAHLSDGLRLITLSKFGGYFFDLDLVHMRPVTHYKNFVALIDLSHVGNAAMHAEYGHPIINIALEEFHKSYRYVRLLAETPFYYSPYFRSDVWGQNGPILMSHVLQRWCGVKELAKLNYITCRGFNVFPFSSFYPVYYNEWKDLFAQPAPYNLWDAKWFNELVIGVHTWNNLNAKQSIIKSSSQVYAQMARFHCPVTCSLAPNVI